MRGWIGVDLDGTLAHYDKWRGPDHVGDPIPAMMERVKRWVAEGKTVKIFTARAFRHQDVPPIRDWLIKHGLGELEITAVKDYGMVELWDDRAVTIESNTGKVLGVSRLGLE